MADLVPVRPHELLAALPAVVEQMPGSFAWIAIVVPLRPRCGTLVALACARLRLQIRWNSGVVADELGAAGIGYGVEADLDGRVPPVDPVADVPVANLVVGLKRLQALRQAVDAEYSTPHREGYDVLA